MLEAKVITTGRGPEIAGTRITVYDVIEYCKAGRHRDLIADTLELSSQQVDIAIRYIEENRKPGMGLRGSPASQDPLVHEGNEDLYFSRTKDTVSLEIMFAICGQL